MRSLCSGQVAAVPPPSDIYLLFAGARTGKATAFERCAADGVEDVEYTQSRAAAEQAGPRST
jgi:hypothetical protein